MSQYPRKAAHFKEWARLMLEQALVPERVQYKSSGSRNSSMKSVKGKKQSRKRTKRFRKRKRTLQE